MTQKRSLPEPRVFEGAHSSDLRRLQVSPQLHDELEEASFLNLVEFYHRELKAVHEGGNCSDHFSHCQRNMLRREGILFKDMKGHGRGRGDRTTMLSPKVVEALQRLGYLRGGGDAETR